MAVHWQHVASKERVEHLERVHRARPSAFQKLQVCRFCLDDTQTPMTELVSMGDPLNLRFAHLNRVLSTERGTFLGPCHATEAPITGHFGRLPPELLDAIALHLVKVHATKGDALDKEARVAAQSLAAFVRLAKGFGAVTAMPRAISYAMTSGKSQRTMSDSIAITGVISPAGRSFETSVTPSMVEAAVKISPANTLIMTWRPTKSGSAQKEIRTARLLSLNTGRALRWKRTALLAALIPWRISSPRLVMNWP